MRSASDRPRRAGSPRLAGGARSGGLTASDLRRAGRPHALDEARWRLPWTFSTFDYRELCALLWAQANPGDAEFETATVSGRDGNAVHTDRGDLTAPLIVDALGWRRVLSNETPIQPPNARLSRGLEVHPHGAGEELELWIDPKYVRAGYAWSFPAERRAARGRRLVLAVSSRQGADRALGRRSRPAARGLPGQLDPPPAAPGRGGRRLLRRATPRVTACR